MYALLYISNKDLFSTRKLSLAFIRTFYSLHSDFFSARVRPVGTHGVYSHLWFYFDSLCVLEKKKNGSAPVSLYPTCNKRTYWETMHDHSINKF